MVKLARMPQEAEASVVDELLTHFLIAQQPCRMTVRILELNHSTFTFDFIQTGQKQANEQASDDDDEYREKRRHKAKVYIKHKRNNHFHFISYGWI
jgi:alpha-galactosidase/6-phospho-beta-glucosidase family protein